MACTITLIIYIAEERPNMRLIGRIQYTKNGKKKALRLIDAVTAVWEDIARQLEFDEAKISVFRKAHPGDPRQSANDMLSSWTRSDTSGTWAKLIEALKAASDDLAITANDFEYALLHQE